MVARARRLPALLALSAATTGCVLLPTLGGPVPGDAPAADVAPSGSAVADVRGVVHCHSLLSHDSRGEFEDIAAAAREVGCRFVVLTDHLRAPVEDDGPDGLVDGVLFLPGFEARAEGGGSLLGLGVRAGIDARGPEAEVAARVAARGGVVGLGHPEQRRAPAPWAQAAELLNLHVDATRDEGKASLLARALVLPPGAFFRSLLDPWPRAGHVYDALARDRPVAALGACDAHEAVRLLGPLGGAVDAYARVLRLATTHALVTRLDRAGVLEALAAGRTYAACELDRSATGFRVEVRRAGEVVGGLGDLVPWAEGLTLEVTAPAAARLVVRRAGSPVARAEADRLTYALRAPGAYRVEADLDGVPWVRTSAVRVAPRP